MHLLEFLSSVIASLAWPVTVVVVIVIARKPLARLLPNLTMFKAKDFEFHFERGLLKAEGDISELSSSTAPTVSDQPPVTKPAYETIAAPYYSETKWADEGTPRQRIMRAWSTLEEALEEYARGHGLGLDVHRPATLLKRLASSLSFPPSIVSAAAELNVLRNAVAHGKQPGISEEQAERYVVAAWELVRQVRLLDGQP